MAGTLMPIKRYVPIQSPPETRIHGICGEEVRVLLDEFGGKGGGDRMDSE